MIATLMRNQRKWIKNPRSPRVNPKPQCDAWKLKFRWKLKEIRGHT